MNNLKGHHHGMHRKHLMLQCQGSSLGASMDCKDESTIAALDFLFNGAHHEASVPADNSLLHINETQSATACASDIFGTH